MPSLRLSLLFAALAVSSAQIFGMSNKRAGVDNHGMSQEEADHMRGTPQGGAAVDRAMQGWDELANNPEQMQEVMDSFKDPEVVAKAKEMINDPAYMRAAKKKLAEMQRKAQEAGMLDAQGNPIPGAATAAAQSMPQSAAMMAAMMQQRQSA